MKKTPLKRLTAVLLMACLLCTMMPAAAFGATGYSVFGPAQELVPVYIEAARDDNYAQEILDLINAERAAAGLNPLAMDISITAVPSSRTAYAVRIFLPRGSDTSTGTRA